MKTAIFLDIDGVLNEIMSDSPYWEEYKQAKEELDKLKTMFKEGTISREEFGEKRCEFHEGIEEKIKEDSAYLSESAIKRLKEICDGTNAIIVLNGSQSKPLYNDTYTFWDTYPGYQTKEGDRIMDLFKKYDIPVAGYSYDIEKDGHKVIPALRYMAEHKNIDNFIIIEDMNFNLGEPYNKERWKTELSDLMDERMEKLIDSMTNEQMIDTVQYSDRLLIKGLTDERMSHTVEVINTLKKEHVKEQLGTLNIDELNDLIINADSSEDLNRCMYEVIKSSTFRMIAAGELIDLSEDIFKNNNCSPELRDSIAGMLVDNDIKSLLDYLWENSPEFKDDQLKARTEHIIEELAYFSTIPLAEMSHQSILGEATFFVEDNYINYGMPSSFDFNEHPDGNLPQRYGSLKGIYKGEVDQVIKKLKEICPDLRVKYPREIEELSNVPKDDSERLTNIRPGDLMDLDDR